MLHIMPVDPVMMMITDVQSQTAPIQPHEVTKARYDAMRREMGLDRPLLVQYGAFLQRVATGNLGRSFQTRRTVWDMISSNAPATIQLAVAGLGLAVLLG